MYINFPAELFLNILQALTIPLIVASLISAVGSLERELIGKIGKRAIIVYLSTTFIASVLGIILVLTFQPGKQKEAVYTEQSSIVKPSLTIDKLLDLIRNLLPENIIEACIYQSYTELIPPENETVSDAKDYYSWEFIISYTQQMNILGLVLFALMVGITLSKMKENAKSVLDFFECIDGCIMIIAKCIIWFSPIAIMFIFIGKIIGTKHVMMIVNQLGFFVLIQLLGLFIHSMLILPLLYFIFIRKLPFKFMKGMTDAVITALITSSSSATLPITINCLKNKIGLDARVCKFCLPIGATMNMDGLALSQAIAGLFIAQIRNIDINMGSIISVIILSAASSIAAAGIPNSGMITLVMVLNALGLPGEDIAIVFVVDWFLDRFQTVVNVLGDAYGSVIVAQLSKKDLVDNENASIPEDKVEEIFSDDQQKPALTEADIENPMLTKTNEQNLAWIETDEENPVEAESDKENLEEIETNKENLEEAEINEDIGNIENIKSNENIDSP